MAESIEAYHPAIEIVDDRYVKWETMGAPTLVADDFFAAGCVLGEAVARTKVPDLLKVVGRALVNGSEVGRGTGADVSAIPTMRWPGSPIIWPPRARACMPDRSCSPEAW